MLEIVLLIFHQEFLQLQNNDVTMMSSRHFEGDIMYSTGYGSLLSDKTCTTVVVFVF